jgi:hypothetical protein
MASPISTHVEAARRLLESAHVSASGGSAEELAAAACRMYQTIVQSFAPVLGATGIRALFARSVKLTAAEFPCLVRTPLVPVASAPAEDHERVVEHVVVSLGRLEPAAAAEVAIAVCASLLGIMTKLIGEPLVWQIIRPALPVIDVSRREETK